VRILLIHPNYHSGGAEIAGSWPPAWAAYLTGSLKDAGLHRRQLHRRHDRRYLRGSAGASNSRREADIVGATSITPSIYKAERALQIAKEVVPGCVTMLGGVHATFMFKQVLSEAPWIDVIVRGEGEEILVETVRAIEAGDFERTRHEIKGLAFIEKGAEGSRILATEARRR